MPAERAPLCHGLAVTTGLVTYLGSLAIHGIATGDVAGALTREVVDVGPYWYFGLPLCYLVAGVLGHLGRARSWRWSLDMLATHWVCMLLFAGSSLSLWPIALLLALVLALPGMLTAWLGVLLHRFRTASHEVDR